MPGARGFTIVEAVVALLILNVGLLGLATTAGAVTRMIRQGRSATVAAALGSARIETVRAEGCSAAGGSETRDGVTVEWEVRVPPFPGARVLALHLRPAAMPGPGDSLTTYLFCP